MLHAESAGVEPWMPIAPLRRQASPLRLSGEPGRVGHSACLGVSVRETRHTLTDSCLAHLSPPVPSRDTPRCPPPPKTTFLRLSGRSLAEVSSSWPTPCGIPSYRVTSRASFGSGAWGGSTVGTCPARTRDSRTTFTTEGARRRRLRRRGPPAVERRPQSASCPSASPSSCLPLFPVTSMALRSMTSPRCRQQVDTRHEGPVHPWCPPSVPAGGTMNAPLPGERPWHEVRR